MFPTLDAQAVSHKHRKRCFDCGKLTQPHCPSATYVCCYCFYYWVEGCLWYKVVDKIPDGSGKWNGMLCLHCFAKRLNRKMKKKDFSMGQMGFFDPKLGTVEDYVNLLVEYANAGENTSLFL